MKFPAIAALLKDRRKTLGLTQDQVSRDSGLHVQFLSRMERGICSVPPESVVRLAEVLKVRPAQIIRAMTKDYIRTVKKRVFG